MTKSNAIQKDAGPRANTLRERLSRASPVWATGRDGGLLRALPSVPRNAHDGEAGFTLVEILVVITIIGLIMGLVGPRVLNYLSESKVKAATIQIESLNGALDLYYLDLGRYPTTAQGLAALVQRPGGANDWNGPYLKNTNVPNDPWGHPYIYTSPSDHGPYEIISLGSDGQQGGTGIAADIKSWEIGGPKRAQSQ